MQHTTAAAEAVTAAGAVTTASQDALHQHQHDCQSVLFSEQQGWDLESAM
jgi:hypothetical protein